MTNDPDSPRVQEAETAKRRKWALSAYEVDVGQLIAAILSVVIAVVGFIYVVYYAPRYGLQVVTLTRSSLVNIAKEVSSDIEILYQGKPVSNLYLVETKLENTGNQPIRSSDYDKPLQFLFPDGAEVVAAKVIDSRLIQFTPTLSTISNTVLLEPHLLNPQARLVLQFIITGIPDSSSPITYTVRASIANILDTTPVDVVESSNTRVQESVPIVFTLLFIFAVSMTIFAYTSFRQMRRYYDMLETHLTASMMRLTSNEAAEILGRDFYTDSASQENDTASVEDESLG